MSIPMFILLDIGGKEVLEFEAMSDLLKCVEKENLFANFPIGATIKDGGKRKRSVMNLYVIVMYNIILFLKSRIRK